MSDKPSAPSAAGFVPVSDYEAPLKSGEVGRIDLPLVDASPRTTRDVLVDDLIATKQPKWLEDREFVDSLAIKPLDTWTGQERMRLHNIATRATQSSAPSSARLIGDGPARVDALLEEQESAQTGTAPALLAQCVPWRWWFAMSKHYDLAILLCLLLLAACEREYPEVICRQVSATEVRCDQGARLP